VGRDLVKKLQNGVTALSRTLIALAIAAAFGVGLVGTMLIFLTGSEVKVPEIVGKSYIDSEDLLSDLGLRIKRRAERYSEEPAGTILEQIPKAGETVKTGQMILVVVSKTVPDGDERPATLKKGADKQPDDSDKIEELISDRPRPSPSPTPSPSPSPIEGEDAPAGETQPVGSPTPTTSASPAQDVTKPPVATPSPRIQR